MNENLNLIEILKDCPKGTKLYSTIFGNVEYTSINKESKYPITFTINKDVCKSVTSKGKHFEQYKGECTLFPSKEQRDWSKFKIKKDKFNPKILQPFDKVLARENKENGLWFADFISRPYNESNKSIFVIGSDYNCIAIPYNDETKHLIGTEDNTPEYYRYWED